VVELESLRVQATPTHLLQGFHPHDDGWIQKAINIQSRQIISEDATPKLSGVFEL
jgi:hypothetical protein